jgi:hypothetical protein
MEETLTHLIINWIEVDHQMILVGATDNERWNLEKNLEAQEQMQNLLSG